MQDMREEAVKRVNEQTEPMGYSVWDYPNSIQYIIEDLPKDKCCLSKTDINGMVGCFLDAVMP